MISTNLPRPLTVFSPAKEGTNLSKNMLLDAKASRASRMA